MKSFFLLGKGKMTCYDRVEFDSLYLFRNSSFLSRRFLARLHIA